MPELAERLLKTIRSHDFVRPGDRVAVAVSGGADSVALLELLLELRRELGIVLSVAHVNHKLRGEESDADQKFVENLASRHQLEFFNRAATVQRHQGAGVESAARRLRYQFFRQLALDGRATKIATAHTLDDLAETVLLRIFRGTGIRGLAGILPRLRLEAEGPPIGEIVRPFLHFRRAELREYLRTHRQPWREDSSNQDVAFLRNRLRRRLLPLITQEFGEAAIEHLASLAEIARAEEEWIGSQLSHTSREAAQEFSPGRKPRVGGWPAQRNPRRGEKARDNPTSTLDVKPLFALPLAARRRAVRTWIEQNAPRVSISFGLIENVLDLARGAAGKTLELPTRLEGADAESTAEVSSAASAPPWILRRAENELILELLSANDRLDYEYRMTVPGEIFVPELASCIRADVVDLASVPQPDRDYLLDRARLGPELLIRNWRAGDRFWPAHTKQERKVKELLSDGHVTGREKKIWPVAVCQGELVWMRGFPVPQLWQPHSTQAVRILDITPKS